MARENTDWPDILPHPENHISPLTVITTPDSTPSTTDTLTFSIETPHSTDEILEVLYPVYIEQGYALNGYKTTAGDTKLTAKPLTSPVGNRPIAILLFALTVASTLYAGTFWYHTDSTLANLRTVLPFMLSVMGVLTIHELGHYFASRYYNVRTSLPYFLPLPTLLGTLGAIINIDGRMPSETARFDIGAAGPIAGLLAAITSITIGLQFPTVNPVTITTSRHIQTIQLGYPPLMEGISYLTQQPLPDPTVAMVNPIVVGGWVGLLITFLNLLPVGQLDGGHILRAMIGAQSESVESAVPLALVALAGYVYIVLDAGFNAVILWIVWAIFTTLFLSSRTHTAINTAPLDDRRRLAGVFLFTIGLLCFTPTPITLG